MSVLRPIFEPIADAMMKEEIWKFWLSAIGLIVFHLKIKPLPGIILDKLKGY